MASLSNIASTSLWVEPVHLDAVVYHTVNRAPLRLETEPEAFTDQPGRLILVASYGCGILVGLVCILDCPGELLRSNPGGQCVMVHLPVVFLGEQMGKVVFWGLW